MGLSCCRQDQLDVRQAQARVRSRALALENVANEQGTYFDADVHDAPEQLEEYVPAQKLEKLESEINGQLTEARQMHNYLSQEAGQIAAHIENMQRTYSVQMTHLVRFTQELRNRNLQLGFQLQQAMSNMQQERHLAAHKREQVSSQAEMELNMSEEDIRRMLEEKMVQKEAHLQASQKARKELQESRARSDRDMQQQEEMIRQLEVQKSALEKQLNEVAQHRAAMEIRLRQADNQATQMDARQRRWESDRQRFHKDRSEFERQLQKLSGNLEYLQETCNRGIPVISPYKQLQYHPN